MNSIWFILVVMINSNGTVNSDLRWPAGGQSNNALSCNQNGPIVADQYTKDFPDAKIFWKCQEVAVSELAKAVR